MTPVDTQLTVLGDCSFATVQQILTCLESLSAREQVSHYTLHSQLSADGQLDGGSCLSAPAVIPTASRYYSNASHSANCLIDLGYCEPAVFSTWVRVPLRSSPKPRQTPWIHCHEIGRQTMQVISNGGLLCSGNKGSCRRSFNAWVRRGSH